MTSQGLSRVTLWRLWCDALGRPVSDPVLIVDDENFFEAGGDSLMAMWLHAMVEEAGAQRVELADVLDALAGADFAGLATLVGDAVPDRAGTLSLDDADG